MIIFTWELGAWPSGKYTLVITMSPVDNVCKIHGLRERLTVQMFQYSNVQMFILTESQNQP